MKMIDDIEMEFRSVGFGDFKKNWNEEDTTQYNSYDVKITYKGNSLTELYGNKF